MGDWTDNLWENRSAKGKTKVVKRRQQTLDAEVKLDNAKTVFVEESAARDAETIFTSQDPDEIQHNLQSYLDTRRAGDVAVGDSGALAEDHGLRTLAVQQSIYRTEFETLKLQATGAQGRLLGILPRATGYDGPTSDGETNPKGPLLLAFAVGIIEWLQTANWLLENISLWAPTLDDAERRAVAFGGALLITIVVMTVTYVAGRKLKEGVVARRARMAEDLGSGSGGELGQGLTMAIGAAAFQTVTLGLRFSTETGDEQAQGAAIVVGLVGFFGAMFVLLWEYSVHTPAVSNATAVFTRRADDATVRDFRRVEYRLAVRIPEEKRDLEVDRLRREENDLQRLQPAARDAGPVSVRVLNEKIADTRKEITALNGSQFNYDPFDLIKEAKQVALLGKG